MRIFAISNMNKKHEKSICVIYRCYANGGNGLGKAIRKAGRE